MLCYCMYGDKCLLNLKHVYIQDGTLYSGVLTGLMTRESVAAGKISFASLTPLHEKQE